MRFLLHHIPKTLQSHEKGKIQIRTAFGSQEKMQKNKNKSNPWIIIVSQDPKINFISLVFSTTKQGQRRIWRWTKGGKLGAKKNKPWWRWWGWNGYGRLGWRGNRPKRRRCSGFLRRRTWFLKRECSARWLGTWESEDHWYTTTIAASTQDQTHSSSSSFSLGLGFFSV